MGTKRLLHLLLLSFFLLCASTGWGAELHGRSSSQLLWFTDFYTGRQIELAEYLNLSLTKLESTGKFGIYGYGRGTQDLNNGEGLNGRLFFLYGEYRDLYDKLDVRAGRQFVNLSAGTALIDGAQVDVKNVGPVGLTLLGGRDVIFGQDRELGHEGDYAVGVAAYLAGFRKTDFDVSWFRKWDQGDVSRDILGASFKQYLLDSVKVYGYGRYDITGEVFNEVLAGVKYFPTASLILTGEWYQSYPTFDTTEIFSVFAVNRYQEGVFRADYTINDKLAVYGGYHREEYGDDGNADVFNAGVILRPVSNVTLGLEYDRHEGDGGRLDGGMLDLLWDVTRQVQLGAGFTVDSYDRELFHSDTGDRIAQKYWLGGKLKVTDKLVASIRLEENVTQRFYSDLQGRFVLNYDF